MFMLNSWILLGLLGVAVVIGGGILLAVNKN